MKIIKFFWVKKGNNLTTYSPFGPYTIKENSLRSFDVYFNNLLLLHNIDTTIEAKKLARKDFKDKVKECIINKEC